MKTVKDVILNLEKEKFQKEQFFYILTFFFLRELLETALEGEFRIWHAPDFGKALLMTIHHIYFYFPFLLIFSFIISLIIKENKFKVLNVFSVFTPVLLVTPLVDFIIGGGRYLGYPSSLITTLKTLVTAGFLHKASIITLGQVIEVLLICFLIFGYVFIKEKNIFKSIISIFIVFILIIVLGGLPGYLHNVFKSGGYIFEADAKQGLFYVFLTLISLSLFTKIEIEYSPLISFAVWGYLTGILKIWLLKNTFQIPPLSFFDFVGIIFIPSFVIYKEKRNYLYILISLSTIFFFGPVPFLFFLTYLLIINSNLKDYLKNLLSANILFLSGISVFFSAYSHLIFPYFYPLFASFMIFITKKLLREFLIHIFFLIFLLLTYNKSFWILSKINELKTYTRENVFLEKYNNFSSGILLLKNELRRGNYEKLGSILEKMNPYECLGEYYFYKGLIGSIFNEDMLFIEKILKLSLISGNPFSLPLLANIYFLKGNLKQCEKILKRSLHHNINLSYSLKLYEKIQRFKSLK